VDSSGWARHSPRISNRPREIRRKYKASYLDLFVYALHTAGGWLLQPFHVSGLYRRSTRMTGDMLQRHWEELSSVIVTALISRVQLRDWQLPSYEMVVEGGKTDEDALRISSAWRD
jgi:hypothetical protein